jgi:hypothetical protein
MKTASAPSQLPFAPRPLPNELFSSWVLRIAHANCVSPEELMLGFQCRHSDLPSLSSLDWGLPLAFLNAMATFSRTSVSSLGRLDLRKRLPQSERALLLRFGVSDRSSGFVDSGRAMPFVHPVSRFKPMCTSVGSGPSLPCCDVIFTRARYDTVVLRVAKTTRYHSARLPPSRQYSAGAAEQN